MGTFNLFDQYTKMPKQAATKFNNVEGYALGLNKGFVVTRVEAKPRPSARRGLGVRAKLVQSIVKSVSGFAPYEKRAMEMFKVGNTKMDKRANKFLKKRLGSIKRAKNKSQLLQELTRKKK